MEDQPATEPQKETRKSTIERKEWQCPKCEFHSDWPAARATHENWHTRPPKPIEPRVKRVISWRCPDHPDFHTASPTGKGIHITRKHGGVEPVPILPGMPIPPRELSPAPPEFDELPENEPEQALPPKEDTIRRSVRSKCGYFRPRFIKPEQPYLWICMKNDKKKAFYFPLRIEWPLCPRCCKPTQYAGPVKLVEAPAPKAAPAPIQFFTLEPKNGIATEQKPPAA